jgi:hypothetical protein
VAVLWRARDWLGRDVALTEAGLAHILDKHPEMIDYLNDVRATIAAPDFSTQDKRYRPRACLYRRMMPNEPRTKVVVHYRPAPPQGSWAGEIITAYRTSKVAEEEYLWS